MLIDSLPFRRDRGRGRESASEGRESTCARGSGREPEGALLQCLFDMTMRKSRGGVVATYSQRFAVARGARSEG